jgi:hypothetical protein
MDEQLIIRFRDLTVELGGTIRDHCDLLNRYGEVWWGWFMQPYETVPRVLFGKLLQRIEERNSIESLLFDTGQGLIYATVISDIRVAPTDRGLQSPDPERSPEYYHRGRYSAWFKLLAILPIKFEERILHFRGFPTRPEMEGILQQLVGTRIDSVNKLRDTKVTLWVIDAPESIRPSQI